VRFSVAEIYEYAMLPELRKSFDPRVRETCISSTGALVNFSGERTGRSPKDKRVVYDELTQDKIWWGDVNKPITPHGYESNRARAMDYLNTRSHVFIIDGLASWDPENRFSVRVICNRPYHALFMKQMLIRPKPDEIDKEFEDGADFTIINGGEFPADTNNNSVTGETSVAVNLRKGEMAILGTQYAGEMKKGLFGVMHYYMPKRGILSMHASANEGPNGDISILFGLSGTGKTTLSADPHRYLLGDDEHCWTDTGIFNIEGGCYAKCIDLSEEKEPEIYRAIKFGAILENIGFKKENRREVDYHNVRLTENTRVAYPLEHIDGCKIPAVGGHPKNIFFLVCDAYGVLPPVAKLDKFQTKYHFISGYTSKVAGTEMGITDPVATFSACYGEAFLPLHPFTYAKMLAEKVEQHGSNVWLINTGWTGGKYGRGTRMRLSYTRKMIDAIHEGQLDNVEYQKFPVFNFDVPKSCPGVPDDVLWPETTWDDKEAFKVELRKLAEKFQENFEKYADETPEEVIQKGGPHSDQ
jgi:phosphoenolpyruvate carboxykinase (ATP)